MLQVLINNEFEPAPAEHLLAAFRILDPEAKGYIKIDVLEQLLRNKGIPLREKEYEQFKLFGLDKTGEKVYYEDYVARLVDENERHLDFLLKGYDSFKPSMGK
jgi:Ca2+-binding EF-hand superfamily protein